MTMGNGGTAALAAVAALACGIGFSSPASAADLGGNCCADLEERVAELEATTARKGTRKVSLEVSGWINKSLLFWDDNVRNDVYSVDNAAAQSRWRFTGSAQISSDLRAGFVYEFGGYGSQSDFVNQTNGGDDLGFSGGRLRQANAWLESRRFGRFTIGKASQATDGIAEIDLSRSEVVAGSNVSAWNASFRTNYTTLGTGPFYLFPAIEHFGGNFDGGRDQLIRWDSPTIAGFQLAASISPGKEYYGVAGDHFVEWDVALRYAAEFNGWRFATGIGYHRGILRDSDNVTPADFTPGGCIPAPGGGCLAAGTVDFNWTVPVDTVVGSSSTLHVPSGFFLTTAGGQVTFNDATFDGDKYTFLYAKSGFLLSVLPVGQTSIYGEFYQYKYHFGGGGYDYLNTSFTSRVWGAGVVQHIDAAAMEVYLAYRFYDSPDINVLGILPVEFGDFHMVQAGMRIRF